MRTKRFLPLLLIFILALALAACGGTGDEEARANESVLAAGEPGAEVAARAAAQADGEDDDDEDAGDPVLEACAYGQGYWKNHPDEWDVDQLMLGDTEYTQEELLAILNSPPQGDASYILAHQLIAAQLNLENDAEAIEAIEQANEWLATHPLGTDPEMEREEAILLAETLDDYNNGLLAAEACDEVEEEEEEDLDDEEEDVDDEEEDDVDDEEDEEIDDEEEDELDDEENCTGADPHPHGSDLADRYEVTYEEIMDLFCDGYGFGEIEIAYNLADETGMDVEEITEMREDGMGWGVIRKELDAHPGRGKDKADRGDERTPPGLDKDKDKDKEDRGRGSEGTPPGKDKDKGGKQNNGNGRGNSGRGNS